MIFASISTLTELENSKFKVKVRIILNKLIGIEVGIRTQLGSNLLMPILTIYSSYILNVLI